MNASAIGLGIKMPTAQEDSVVETTVHLVGDMKKLEDRAPVTKAVVAGMPRIMDRLQMERMMPR